MSLVVNELERKITICENNIKKYKSEIDDYKNYNFPRKKILSYISKINIEKNKIVKYKSEMIKLNNINDNIISNGLLSTASITSVFTIYPSIDIVTIGILENYDRINIDVIDDVYKSATNKYYLITTQNIIIYINSVLDINKITNNNNKSILYNWFINKEQNYLRIKKLKKIL